MSAIDPNLLSEGTTIPDEDTLLAADPSGAWGALVQLRAEAVAEAPAQPPVPDLQAVARWCTDPPELADEAVRFYAEHSLLMAELLEGSLDALAPAAARRLAAAPDLGPATDPWPARYVGGDWRVVLGIDEAGWLYFAVEAVPEGAPSHGTVVIPDLGLTLPSEFQIGAASSIDQGEELLGGHDLNPIRSLEVDGVTLHREQK